MITKETFAFLQELEAHNSKEWFDRNRKRYEQHAKQPFRALCSAILDRLHSGGAEMPGLPTRQIVNIPADVKDGLMRINRDMRFVKEGGPYHTYLRSAFVPGGRKSGNPGFYLTVEPRQAGAGGGVYKAPRKFEPGLPALDGVDIAPDYRPALDAMVEHGVKKNTPVIAIVHISPGEFVALDDQVSWVLARFADVAPLIAAMLS